MRQIAWRDNNWSSTDFGSSSSSSTILQFLTQSRCMQLSTLSVASTVWWEDGDRCTVRGVISDCRPNQLLMLIKKVVVKSSRRSFYFYFLIITTTYIHYLLLILVVVLLWSIISSLIVIIIIRTVSLFRTQMEHHVILF